jgi:hypothetical protein
MLRLVAASLLVQVTADAAPAKPAPAKARRAQ